MGCSHALRVNVQRRSFKRPMQSLRLRLYLIDYQLGAGRREGLSKSETRRHTKVAAPKTQCSDQRIMPCKTYSGLGFIFFIGVASSHLCFLEQRIDIETGLYHWTLPIDDDVRCSCTKVVPSPPVSSVQSSPCHGASEVLQYWFTDTPWLLVNRSVWGSQRLQQLLECPASGISTRQTDTNGESSSNVIDVSPTVIATSATDKTTDVTDASTPVFATSAATEDYRRYKSTESSTDVTDASSAAIATLATTEDSEGCNQTSKLGLTEGLIPDGNMVASSSDGFHVPSLAKLNSGNYWENEVESNPWIQATLLVNCYVHGVVIQGVDGPTSAPSWASNLKIQTGLDVDSLAYVQRSSDGPPIITFPANNRTHANLLAQVQFPRVVVAKVVRLEPLNCYKFDRSSSQCMLLFDLLGCVYTV